MKNKNGEPKIIEKLPRDGRLSGLQNSQKKCGVVKVHSEVQKSKIDAGYAMKDMNHNRKQMDKVTSKINVSIYKIVKLGVSLK